MVDREEMDIYGGDIQLSNMIITSVERTRTPENENGLEAVITLQELPRLELVRAVHDPDNPNRNPVKTDNNDQAATAAGKYIHKGIAKVQDAGAAINDRVSGVFSV
jgi:hypothetical protein